MNTRYSNSNTIKWANLPPETCRADLKRLINEKVVASCWLFTSLYRQYRCMYQYAVDDSQDALVHFPSRASCPTSHMKGTECPSGLVDNPFQITNIYADQSPTFFCRLIMHPKLTGLSFQILKMLLST
jgi:hypothetical protein